MGKRYSIAALQMDNSLLLFWIYEYVTGPDKNDSIPIY